MSEVNFQELLAKQVDTVERPKVFPIGNYQAIVAGHEFGKSSQKETDYVRFWCKLIGPDAEVDAELFEDAGGMEALNNRKPIKLDLYITPDALYRLRIFLEDTLGLNCAGRPFDAVIPEADNCSFTANIKHQAGSKEGEFFMNIDDHSPAA